MQSTMMSYPLTLVHALERAGRCYPKTEIVADCCPDVAVLHAEHFSLAAATLSVVGVETHSQR